jgi:hypothetical protein
MLSKKMIYGLLILFVGLMSYNTSFAQVEDQEMSTPLSFSAIVVDASNGQPLQDVTVKVKGTELEATTDQTGKFTFDNLEVPVGTSSEPGSADFQGDEVTFEIDHEGYEPFSKTLSVDEIRQNQQQVQNQEMQDDSQLTRFELEPETEEYEQE